MLENLSGARGRNVALVGAICIVAVAAAAYFIWLGPRGPAQAESAAQIDIAADKDAKSTRPHFPFMRLEAQYAGPFRDTIIQRWRDPIDGRVCYLYLPVRVKHAPIKDKNEIVDYGRNNIGSISCSGPVMVRQAPHAAPQPQPKADHKK